MISSQPARMRCGKDFVNRVSHRTCQSQPARMRCGKECLTVPAYVAVNRRNPHECAVAKDENENQCLYGESRNPHECAVAKIAKWLGNLLLCGRNPHECAVAKSKHHFNV